MKSNRLLSLFLLLSFSLLLVSCGSTLPTETTADRETMEATSAPVVTEPTTAEPPTATETTTPEEAERIRSGRYYSLWRPEIPLTFYPWTVTPSYEYDTSDRYDIEIIADIPSDPYDALPKTITLQISNKTGESIKQYGSPYLEIYERTAMGGIGAWVRIPYINEEEADAGIIERESSYTYEMVVRNWLQPLLETQFYALYYNANNITNNHMEESALCRIVLYLDDGPHYVEFTLSYRIIQQISFYPDTYWQYGTWTYDGILPYENANKDE